MTKMNNSMYEIIFGIILLFAGIIYWPFSQDNDTISITLIVIGIVLLVVGNYRYIKSDEG